MSIGMTYEQYWYGDVWMVESFRKADEIRQKRMNSESWWQGMYIYDAIGCMAPVLQAFAKKGTRPRPYPAKPYEIGTNHEPTEEKELIRENERLKSILFFKNWSKSVGKKFGK